MTVASRKTPPVKTPWLKKPIPPTLSGLFMSGNFAAASLSSALRSRGEDPSRTLDTRLEVFVGIMYCGFDRVKSDARYRVPDALTGLPVGATGPTSRC